MKILNIAEKPSVAKEISSILSNNNCRRRTGASKYNPIFEFNCNVLSQNDFMVVSSIAGHMMKIDYPQAYNNWKTVDPIELFTAPIEKTVRNDMMVVYKQIQTEVRGCDVLCLWLDCDREGENIAFEVIECVQKVKKRIRILNILFMAALFLPSFVRAHFSALIPNDVWNAVRTLTPPDENQSNAAYARQEIDLRIGCTFTRFQTLLLRNSIPELDSVVSYGPCQFPTLGFVVERYLQRENFVPEPFWFISATIQPNVPDERGIKPSLKLHWGRNRLFDKYVTVTLFSLIEKEKEGIVVKLNEKTRRKFKPLPLQTVELQKRCARYFKISSEEVMKICEMLYQKGFISYPRTETAKFPDGTDFQSLIGIQTGSESWGGYASMLLDPTHFMAPRAGKGDDHAHPPIHPTKLLSKPECQSLNSEFNPEKVYCIYEYISRHFLACCSKDAVLAETDLEVMIGNEAFSAKGTIIKERNYLEVYKYEKQSENFLPRFTVGEHVPVVDCCVEESVTVAPELLSEPELIALMDKEGIGTDATISEHIATILKRNYAEKNAANRFLPTNIGLALVETYMYLEFPLYKPFLRAHMESECSRICDGSVHYQDVIDSCIGEMVSVYSVIVQKKKEFKDTFIQFMRNTISGRVLNVASVATVIQDHILNCKVCGNDMSLMGQKKGKNMIRFLQCNSCNMTLSLPSNGSIVVLPATCPLCGYNVVEIQSGNGYTICPNCYSNSTEDRAGFTMPCFRCNAVCPYASLVMILLSPLEPEEISVCPCYYCRNGMLVLRKSRNQEHRILAVKCTNVNCRLVFSINTSIIQDISVVQETCPRCSNHLNTPIPLLSLTFHSHVQLSMGMSNPYSICVCGHDERVRHYGFVNMAPMDMSTPPFSPAEITQMVNAKSQSHSVVESAPVTANQLSWLAPVASKSSSSKQSVTKSSISASAPSQSRPLYPQTPRPSAQNVQPPPPRPSIHPIQSRPARPVSSQPLRSPQPPRPPAQPIQPIQYMNSRPLRPTPQPLPSSSFTNSPVVPPNYHPPYPFVTSPSSTIKCDCGEPAALRTTTKPGNNQGRQFYCCGRPREQQCSFFMWSDDPRVSTPSTTHTSIPGSSIIRGPPHSTERRTCYNCGQRGHLSSQCPNQKKEFSQRKPVQRKQRCCSHCHQPGHTKKNCPALKNQFSGSDYTTNDYGVSFDDMDMEDMGDIYWEA